MTLGIAVVYERVRGQQGSGMGDVKLLAAIGLYLGLYALLALFLANVIGAVWGIVAARTQRRVTARRLGAVRTLPRGGLSNSRSVRGRRMGLVPRTARVV